MIIVQVGAWPFDARAARVRAAQAHFVQQDSAAALVETSDLGRFYHYDALSCLVMGDRIADKLAAFASFASKT